MIYKIKVLFLVSIAWVSLADGALALKCEGWLQPEGMELQRFPMKIDEQTAQNWRQSVSSDGYTFKINWDVSLDAIYTEIAEGNKRILFTTARVPTFPHNDSFTDLKLPSGLRLAVSCAFAQ